MPGESIQTLVEQPSTTIDLTAVADNVKLLIVTEPITVLQVRVLVVVATTATAFVVDFDRRVTPGTDVGRIDQGVARLTAPASVQAAGVTITKNVQVDLNPGDEVAVQVVTATGGASTGIPSLRYVARAASPTDFGDQVAGT